jgi:hypothetical protein
MEALLLAALSGLFCFWDLSMCAYCSLVCSSHTAASFLYGKFYLRTLPCSMEQHRSFFFFALLSGWRISGCLFSAECERRRTCTRYDLYFAVGLPRLSLPPCLPCGHAGEACGSDISCCVYRLPSRGLVVKCVYLSFDLWTYRLGGICGG